MFSGKKNNDQHHPDYVPSVFPHKKDLAESAKSAKLDRYERKKKGEAQSPYVQKK